MRVHAFSALTIVLSFLAIFNPPAFADDVLYPVEMILTTTSDWTDVRFIGCTLVVQSYEIQEGSQAPGLQVAADSALSIGKNSFDPTQVVVRITAYLANAADTWIRVAIDKGHIGSTNISILATGSQSIASFTHTGVANNTSSENTRTFDLRTSEIASRVAVQILDTPSEASIGGQKVLAFYYPWYGTPGGPSGEWVHWTPSQSNYAATHIPTAGYYDSLDTETIRRHIREAKSADIDGFVASWWGVHSFEDRAFALLLQIAEEEGFLVAPYYEAAQSPLQMVTDIGFILSRYGSSPAFLRVSGSPVVFFYVRVIGQFSLSQWGSTLALLDERGHGIFAIADSLQPQYLSVFQGLHTYNPVGMSSEEVAEQYASASLAARIHGGLFAATVLPGYQEAAFRASSPVADRANGETYHSYWDIARDSTPHWILITSFNEWHEGSEIEPSVEFGTSYLVQTEEEASVWRSGGPVEESTVSDRDSDGVPDNVDYCPDWPGSAAANGC
ncbi:hypothetical protein KKG90_09650 [Candidatus Bipolaricaulota bacterium]|nr:hypothetical protein [Candidatus Bipolaricaulota bacterium]